MLHKKRRKFIFLVQGEGRGHMTQAISLYQKLCENGHSVPCIFIGISDRRKIPEYFPASFDTRIEQIRSPNFISDKNNKSIRLIPSILYNARFLYDYYKSLLQINSAVVEYQPDAIINFYDFLGGFYNFFFRPDLKFYAIGHTFTSVHPSFQFAGGRWIEKKLFLLNNKLNSLGADKKIGLSFTPLSPEKIGNTIIAPPLLRNLTLSLKVKQGDFLLGYMVNDGYSKEIIDWHKSNTDIKIICFWDKKDEPEIKYISKNLVFHQLNDNKFLTLLAECKGLITTAGFESISEALLLGKPVLMVPVSGQYEQTCNAIDAARAGAGIFDDHFNISRFVEYIDDYISQKEAFRKWLESGSNTIIKEFTSF